MQGLAPAFIGGFSDEAGRRPSYVICFVVYIAANIGLGVQNSYPALMVLRCIQSAGSSATVALANAVVADMVTSQERGIYVSYMSIAPQAGPSLGPVIGGLLAKYLGWHSIFWFLLIVAGVVFMPFLFFFPETCRTVVDDGSVPPPKWNRCYTNNSLERRLINAGWAISYEKRNILAKERNLRFPNPLRTVRIIFMKESGFALWYIAIVCCGLYATTILIPNQFGSVYNFNELQISLCYLPLGVGSMLAAVVRGRIIDSRYRHYAKKLGMSLESNRNVDLSNFPIERARLEVALPTLALGSLCIIGFGWMIEYKVNLAGPLIFLFVIGFCVSASMNTVAVLLIDVFPGRAGTATAANNMCRCWLGAAATSGVSPMIGKVGIGWTTTFFGGLAIVFSPILWYIMINGPTWRRTTQENKDREQAERAGRADVRDEEGNA
jgi:multidrug resistance protein